MSQTRICNTPAFICIVLFCLCLARLGAQAPGTRPAGPCDIYTAASNPCVAAHSTTRALYASYNGPLYAVMRASDGKALDIGVVQPHSQPAPDGGGYADSAAQDAFCAGTHCWIIRIYDQSPKHNDLIQPPRGGFSGPAMGGLDNLPLADAAPTFLMGHKVYGVFVLPGSGLRNNSPRGTAVEDQAEGQYWVINGHHSNAGCCFDYGNAEIDSHDDDNGTMEAMYYGDSLPWYHGSGSGPWSMTDQENNLVGCVNDDASKLCQSLSSIGSRFVTAIFKGEPHHWVTLAGDSQHGSLRVLFDGRRVDSSYDPMRKQGAILLGNGGDNSNTAQGTFYEGAMTAAGTYPTAETDQRVQQNIVAAQYAAFPLMLSPVSVRGMPSNVETFLPGSSKQIVVSFSNTLSQPLANVDLHLTASDAQWRIAAAGKTSGQAGVARAVQPGETIRRTFDVSAGPAAWNGDLVAHATWTDSVKVSGMTALASKVRSALPVKINEYRIDTEDNPSNSFIELYNAGPTQTDISNWTLTLRPTQQVVASTIEVPGNTSLLPGHFYLLGLATSGLAVPERAGANTLHLRSTVGLAGGDTIEIGSGKDKEIHTLLHVGTAAAQATTVWQPQPDGTITIPAGSANIPVESVAGFTIGQQVSLGYGADDPWTGRVPEKYEIVTVTAVGKPGTQAYLAHEALAGASNLKVTSVDNISVGDQIRLDIESVGHGVETVTVKHVGTSATQTNLVDSVAIGATHLKVRSARHLTAGDAVTVGTPVTAEQTTITFVQSKDGEQGEIEVQPALTRAHGHDEWVVVQGTGLDLREPLKFSHAENLPFSDRGSGITVTPATAFPHHSDEPVQALGTGVTLSDALNHDQPIHAAVLSRSASAAGYQGAIKPDQWFGGPILSTTYTQFGSPVTDRQGSFVLRDRAGLTVDTVNYGSVVDPYAAEGYQAESGGAKNGCYAPAPGAATGIGVSAGRRQDGLDTDSNCNDFLAETATIVSMPSVKGATVLYIDSVDGLFPSETIRIGSGGTAESIRIHAVGTAGGAQLETGLAKGTKRIPVTHVAGFAVGQTVTIDDGPDMETATIGALGNWGENTVTLAQPLQRAHKAGAVLHGSGITVASPLLHAHARGTSVAGKLPTPGAPNDFSGASKTAGLH